MEQSKDSQAAHTTILSPRVILILDMLARKISSHNGSEQALRLHVYSSFGRTRGLNADAGRSVPRLGRRGGEI